MDIEDGKSNTVSGEIIDFHCPDPMTIRLEDIAHSLSFICRFNGHVHVFYSVAAHCNAMCVLMQHYFPGWELEGLMHDAAEAYLHDIGSPLKRILRPIYKPLEMKMEAAIAERFGLETGPEVEKAIKCHDLALVRAEHAILQKNEMVAGYHREAVSHFAKKSPAENRAIFIANAKGLMEKRINPKGEYQVEKPSIWASI